MDMQVMPRKRYVMAAPSAAEKARQILARRQAVPTVAKTAPAKLTETDHARALRFIAEGRIEDGCRLAARLINAGEETGFLRYVSTSPVLRGAQGWLAHTLSLAQIEPVTDVVNITPDRAQVLLGCNTNNRRVKPNNLTSLIRDIVNSRWDLNGESLIVSRTGKLNDGQHRLFAVILTGRHIKSVMTFGVTDESMATVDIGEKRTNADRFNLRGESEYIVAAAIAGLAFEMETGRAGTTTEVMGWFERHEDAVRASIAAKGTNVRGIGPSSAGVAAMHLLSLGAKETDIREFFKSIRTNENTKAGNPARTIHYALYPTAGGQKMIKMKRAEWVSTLCHHFVVWKRGKRSNNVILGEPLPKAL